MAIVVTVVQVIWTFLSVCTALACTFSFASPTWFIKNVGRQLASFGLFSYCVQNVRSRTTMCLGYGDEFSFTRIPHGAWQAGCVLFGGGCVMLCAAAIIAMASCCVPYFCERRISVFAGYMQSVAVVICSVGLIIYPVGLESNVIKMYCGQSAASFNPGNCEIGWGYVLAIMGTALTMFGPFLSKYAIDKPRLEDSEEFV
ncbi:LHFPL tetraspan subfamily member 2 protein-like [Branchiostoma floridae x Branchiostoma belcheri]